MIKKSKSTDSVGKQLEDHVVQAQVAQAKTGFAEAGSKSSHSVSSKDTAHGNKGKSVAKKTDEDELDLSLNTGAESAADPIVLAQAETGTATDAATAGSSSSAAGTAGGGAGSTAAGAATGAEGAGAFALSDAALGTMILAGTVGVVAIASTGGGAAAAVAAAPAGDTTAPAIQSMTAAGTSVVLTYNEALDAVNVPVPGNFAVTVGGVANVVTGVAVDSAAKTVTLTLTTAVATGAAVQVIYTDPTAGNDANAIQDATGNDAVSFTTGVVADGYIRGAQIYIDTNNNGVADASELLTGVVTNANGNYILPAGTPAGVIIATGGVNIDTGVPNTLVLKAPAGSTIVSPLTTLVQAYIVKNAGTSVANASATIVNSLGLTLGTDLTTYDPLAALAAAPADATALAVQKAAVQVATVVTLAAAAPAGTTTSADAAAAVITNLVTQMGTVAAPVGVNLTNAADITTALGTASTAVAATIDTATTAIAAATTLTQISTAQSVALDTINPAAPTAVALAAASDTGSSSTDNLTNNSTPAVRVSFNATATDGTAAVAGNTVTVLNGATTVGTATLTSTNIANGYVDVTLSTQVDGAHTFTATLADIAGNASVASAASPTITLDTAVPAAPTVALTTDSGAADLVTNVGTLAVTGTETGATVQYSTDTGATWGGSFTAAEGANTVHVRQVDVAGNPSTAASITFTLDTTIATPTVALAADTGSSNSDLITNAAALTFSTAATDVTRTYTVDSGTASSTYTAPTGAGSHTVTVTDTDTAGNTANASIAFTLDTSAPTLSSSAPVDGAIDVVGSSIVLTFGEAVAAGTGNIVISDGVTPINISVTDTAQVAISGSTVTITPTTAPAPATAYTVTIASGVITDLAGNAFAGIASGGLDFTMADLPTVTITTTEADNLLNVGDSASITFTLSAASTDFASTDVTASGGTLSGFSGSGTTYTAMLTPTASSTANATVSVAQGAFTSNSLGNLASSTLTISVDTIAPATPTVALTTNSGSTLDSITNSAALTFSTADGTRSIVVDGGAGSGTYTAPTTDGLHTVTVTDTDAAGNAANASITFTLDTTIATPTVALTTNSGSTADSITNSAALTFSTAATDVTRTYTVDSGTASGTYTAPTTGGAHTVMVTDTDTAGNTANASITFTLDAAAPTLSFSTPADNATNVSGSIVLTFSEAVQAGTGNIVITDGVTPYNIAVGDTTQVAFSGTTVTITPTTAPAPSTAYSIQLASGVINDAAGNAYAGIADATTLNFTTAAAPTLTSTIDNVTNFDVTSNIVLTASESVTAVAGKNITIVNDGGTGFHGEATVNTQIIAANDTSKITITNNTITINPGYDLDLANNYHILVDAGAFVNAGSVASAAVSDVAAMNFSTVTPSNGLLGVGSAAASQAYDASGALANSFAWMDIEGVGATSNASSSAVDLQNVNIALVFKDYASTAAGTTDGIDAPTFWVEAQNFGAGDLLYIDNQSNANPNNLVNNGPLTNTPAFPTTEFAFASTNSGQSWVDITPAGTATGTESFVTIAALQTLLGTTYVPIISA